MRLIGYLTWFKRITWKIDQKKISRLKDRDSKERKVQNIINGRDMGQQENV